MALRTFALALTGAAFLTLTACAGRTDMEMTERDADGHFVVGCGFFDPYNPNMTVRTLDGRFPGGGGESEAISRANADTDCGQW